MSFIYRCFSKNICNSYISFSTATAAIAAPFYTWRGYTHTYTHFTLLNNDLCVNFQDDNRVLGLHR